MRAVGRLYVDIVHGEGHRRRHVEQLEAALVDERDELGILGIDESLGPAQEYPGHLVGGDELPAAVVHADQFARLAPQRRVLFPRGAHGRGVLREGRMVDPFGFSPLIANAKVQATVLEHDRAKKILVFKKKRKKQYRRTQGHRQDYTAVRIDNIIV